MKEINVLDIITRTLVFIIAFWGFGYLVPKIIIPDIIRDFKRFWKAKPKVEEIEKEKQQLNNNQITIDFNG